jgi:outer membrane biosynthesis protein TonB
MGLWEFLQQWPRGRIAAGIGASILIHLLVVAAALWGLALELTPQWKPKPGDTLIVELPRPEESGAAGTPSAASPPPPPREVPVPPRQERRVAAAPRMPEPAPPAPRGPAPKPAAPAPVVPDSAPRATEPAPPPEPAPRAAEPAPKAEPVTPPAPTPPASPPAAPTPAAAEPRLREGAERQIASVPPSARARPSVSDVRAALRAGAGGRGHGRGGIEGDPIPLDSPDARYSDYLDQVRRKIKEKWGFPCVKNAQTRECEVHSTSLDVHFGILRDGQVQFVDIVKVADHEIYDEYAVNAIKLASPFPPVPPVMLRAMREGSTGLAISARFSYVVESSLTNLLR